MILLKSIYGLTNYVRLFDDELTEWLLEAGFIQYKFQMYIYYKYALDGTKNVGLSYVDDCVYRYTYESLGKWLVETIGKIFYVILLGYGHWFMSTRISQIKDHYISVDQSRYNTSILAKYLDTATVKTITKFYKPFFHLI